MLQHRILLYLSIEAKESKGTVTTIPRSTNGVDRLSREHQPNH